MVISWAVVAVIVAVSSFSFFMGWLLGATHEIDNINKEQARNAAEEKQQRMWNEYLNALKEGKNGR